MTKPKNKRELIGAQEFAKLYNDDDDDDDDDDMKLKDLPSVHP